MVVAGNPVAGSWWWQIGAELLRGIGARTVEYLVGGKAAHDPCPPSPECRCEAAPAQPAWLLVVLLVSGGGLLLFGVLLGCCLGRGTRVNKVEGRRRVDERAILFNAGARYRD